MKNYLKFIYKVFKKNDFLLLFYIIAYKNSFLS